MTKREKRLQRMRQNPRNVSFETLRKVLEDYGFVLQRSSGSHWSFSVQIGVRLRLLVVPYRKPVKPVYIREAIKLIDEIQAEGEYHGPEDE